MESPPKKNPILLVFIYNLVTHNFKMSMIHYPGWGARPKPALIRLSRPKSALISRSTPELALIRQTRVAHWGCQTDLSRTRGFQTQFGCAQGVPGTLRSRIGGTLTYTFNGWSSSNHWYIVFFRTYASFYDMVLEFFS